jgi:predicted nucleotidyltransferase
MSPKILERSRPVTSILDFAPGKVLGFLKEKLATQNVLEAYVFGSFAKDQCGAWSDLDLVAILQTELPFLERPRDFANIYELGVPIDLLVYTPQEFAILRNNGSAFWRDFERHHIRIL